MTAGAAARRQADHRGFTRVLIERARREGNTAEVERLTARLQQLESGSGSASTAQ